MKMFLVSLTKGNQVAELAKENPLTIWVKLDNGDIVKRHKRKHVISEAR